MGIVRIGKMNQTNTMKDLLTAERPYEKCEHSGAGSLTDAELLAVLLRTGTKGEYWSFPGVFYMKRDREFWESISLIWRSLDR